MHYGITLWVYLSEPLVKDSHKRLSSTEKPQYRVLKALDQTLPLRARKIVNEYDKHAQKEEMV